MRDTATPTIWKFPQWSFKMKKIIAYVLGIVLVSGLYAQFFPRAQAKFCFNQVIWKGDLAKYEIASQGLGCSEVVVTPIPETPFIHIYSVVVYVGE